MQCKSISIPRRNVFFCLLLSILFFRGLTGNKNSENIRKDRKSFQKKINRNELTKYNINLSVFDKFIWYSHNKHIGSLREPGSSIMPIQ